MRREIHTSHGVHVEEECLLAELLDLRQATAQAIGRQTYTYEMLDGAVETGHLEAMRRARDAFDQLDDDVRDRVIAAAGMVS